MGGYVLWSDLTLEKHAYDTGRGLSPRKRHDQRWVEKLGQIKSSQRTPGLMLLLAVTKVPER